LEPQRFDMRAYENARTQAEQENNCFSIGQVFCNRRARIIFPPAELGKEATQDSLELNVH